MRSWLIALSGAVILSSGAVAQQAPSGARAACQADIGKFCSGVQPGDGRIRTCMAQHRDELSQGCREALQNARAHRRAVKSNAAPQDPSSSAK
jgi:hypothetical protein